MPSAIVPADLPTRRPSPTKPGVQLTPPLSTLPMAFRFTADAHTPAASMPRQSTIQTIAWKTGTMIHPPASTSPATLSTSDTEVPPSTAFPIPLRELPELPKMPPRDACIDAGSNSTRRPPVMPLFRKRPADDVAAAVRLPEDSPRKTPLQPIWLPAAFPGRMVCGSICFCCPGRVGTDGGSTGTPLAAHDRKLNGRSPGVAP
jgi:hypothetical protein